MIFHWTFVLLIGTFEREQIADLKDGNCKVSPWPRALAKAMFAMSETAYCLVIERS